MILSKEQQQVWDILDDGPRVWTTTITEDGILEIPPDLLDRMGWQEGDNLHIDINEDDCIILSKL
jgi:bifunctional DNA-binding transcriptional regulator/antitoxin component of YhaV-PrlF toxin-antitoxin module